MVRDTNYSNLRKAQLIMNDLKIAENCWLNLNKSQVMFNEIINKISLSTSHHNYTQDLEDTLVMLNNSYLQTESPLISYYYNTLKAESLQNNNSYSEAAKCFNNLLDLCIENPSVYTKNRHGNALINLANNYLFTQEYSSSMLYANQSKEYFKNIPFTLILVDEILFFAYFYYAGEHGLCCSRGRTLRISDSEANLRIISRLAFS